MVNSQMGWPGGGGGNANIYPPHTAQILILLLAGTQESEATYNKRTLETKARSVDSAVYKKLPTLIKCWNYNKNDDVHGVCRGSVYGVIIFGTSHPHRTVRNTASQISQDQQKRKQVVAVLSSQHPPLLWAVTGLLSSLHSINTLPCRGEWLC